MKERVMAVATTSSNLLSLYTELDLLKNQTKVSTFKKFFKTGKGQYGGGDEFLGISVPNQRLLSKKHLDLSFQDLEQLLKSNVHEHRFLALLILISQYEQKPEEAFQFYLKNIHCVNNWDLVDLSAPAIVGKHLRPLNKDLLYRLAPSNNLWERRIAIVSTLTFIRNNEFKDTLKICEVLLTDKQDLIQKAAGWMLREVGKKDERVLLEFLDENATKMPRTMLRYSLERLNKNQKEHYMKK